MSAVSPAEIADLRALARDLGMPDSYQIERTTLTGDNAGGSTEATAIVETGPCRLDASALRPDERIVGARAGGDINYIATLPYDTTLTNGDVLLVNGRRFEVEGVAKPGKLGIVTTAVLRERG